MIIKDLGEKYDAYYKEVKDNKSEELRKKKSMFEVEVSSIKNNRTKWDLSYLPNFTLSLITIVIAVFGVLVTVNSKQYTYIWYLGAFFSLIMVLVFALIYNAFKEKKVNTVRLKELEAIEELELKIRVINDVLANS